jgi:hypothetical protein
VTFSTHGTRGSAQVLTTTSTGRLCIFRGCEIGIKAVVRHCWLKKRRLRVCSPLLNPLISHISFNLLILFCMLLGVFSEVKTQHVSKGLLIFFQCVETIYIVLFLGLVLMHRLSFVFTSRIINSHISKIILLGAMKMTLMPANTIIIVEVVVYFFAE